MSACGNYSYSGPNHESYSGPNHEPFANLSNAVLRQRVDAFGAVPSASRGRMRSSRQYLVLALALGLVVGLPIGAAQATSIHQTGNLPGGLLASEFTVGPTSPGYESGATVTWSLLPTGPGAPTVYHSTGTFSHLSEFMPAGLWKDEIVRAFAAWSDVADITFTEVVDDGAPFNAVTTSGDIRIGGAVFDGPSGTLAHGFFPPVNGLTAASDIHFDIAETWTIGFSGPDSFDIFTVAAHEIGHAIGLAHSSLLQSLMYPSYSEDFVGLQADDILGAQFIYGAATPPSSILAPEPGTLVLLTTGLIGLAVGRRKLSN